MPRTVETTEPSNRSLTRRTLLAGTAAGVGAGLLTRRIAVASMQEATAPILTKNQDAALLDELVIDLPSEPPTLDPALVYDVNGWSAIHSLYDSLIQYGADGQIEPLLAESFTPVDPLTWEIKLRPGRTFTNGEPVDAASIAFTLAHIRDEKTASQIAGNFATIAEVREIDATTVQFVMSAPSPWLPAQVAAWFCPLPPGYAAESDFGMAPVGTGPYTLEEWVPGERLTLIANPDYPSDSPKGTPVAAKVTFRFVPEEATRVADLLAGTAHIVRNISVDNSDAITSAGAQFIAAPIAGASFIRIATDTKPFDDVRVRQALNHAVDVPAIIDALLGGSGTHLANVFVPNGLGYNPDLAPYAKDTEKAKALLAEAGFPDGLNVALEHTTSERTDLVEAVAGQLGEAGFRVELMPVETATFNSTWKDSPAPLRFVTWRPLFDPFTLLNLLFNSQGFLSRHDNPTAQALIEAGANETDPAARADIYRQLGEVLHDEPGAIYLYSLTSTYGVAAGVTGWEPRADDVLIPTARD